MIADGTAYYATVSATSFAVVVFGAALVGSRLVSLAERASTLDRERGDFVNQKVSSGSSPQAGWAERGRRNELADLHVLVRRLRAAVVTPVLIALATGVASLGPYLGWPNDSTLYRTVVLAGLLCATTLWIRMLLGLADDVLVFTRAAYGQRAKERREATEAGQSYLVSGDPAALVGAFERLEEVIGVPSWRHPIRRYKRWQSKRDAGRDWGRV